MKKFTKIFAFAMALMMVFALQAPVSAAEKGAVQAVNQEQAQATVQQIHIHIEYIAFITINL